MDPNTNDNPGATAPSQSQDDLGQTRYFPPQGQAQADQPQGTQYNPYGSSGSGAYAGPAPYTSAGTPAGTNPYTGAPANGNAAPVPPVPPAAPVPPPFYGNGQNHPAQGFNWQQYAGSQDRNRVMWGTILVAMGALFLFNQLFSFSGLGSLVLLLIGGIFMYAYLNTRMGYRIGYLIPGSILLGLGVGTLLEDLDYFNIWSGNVVTLTLGLGFCTIWFFERKHWWALIPGGILVLVGVSNILSIGSLWPVILIALGLYLIYDQTRRHSAH